MGVDWNWTMLCGDNDDLTIWDKSAHRIGFCFESLAIVCPIFLFLGILSAYYAGFKRRTVRRTRRFTNLICTRIIITFCVLLCIIIDILLRKFYLKIPFPLINCIVYGMSIGSWVCHLFYLWTLRTCHTSHSRGPCIMVFAWALTLICTCLRIADVVHDTVSLCNASPEKIVTYVVSVFQVLYLTTLVPRGQGEVRSMNRLRTVNVDENEDERTPLLGNGSLNSSGSYGRLLPSPIWSDLGVAVEGVNCLGRLTFRWVLPLMEKGAKGLLLGPEYLFELPHSLRTAFIDVKFWILYTDLQLRNGLKTTPAENGHPNQIPRTKINVSLFKVLLSCFGKEYFLLGIPKFFADTLIFLTPLLLNAIVTYKEDSHSPSPSWHGYCYVAGMCATTLTVAFLSSHFQFRMNNVGLKIRAALVTAIYRKSLSCNTATMMRVHTGEIVNYMSTDVDRIQNFCPSFHQFWSLPIQITICLGLLYMQVGLAFLAGIGFMLILIPINRWLATKIGKLSISMMTQKDKRVKLMNEILRGITAIKFCVWERHFLRWIYECRTAELDCLKKRKYLDAACVYFWATTPVLISLLTFLTFLLLGNTFTAAKVFTCLTLVNMLIVPLNAFPWVLNGLVEAWVSLHRIENLLKLPDTNLLEYYTEDKESTDPLQVNADFSWDDEYKEKCVNESSSSSSPGFCLSNVRLNLQEGQLIGVVGTVGSGKTSLMHAILAEMNKIQGFITVSDFTDGFGFVPQEAWILQGTIRSNILLGKPYDSELYREVLEACSLIEDLELLPNGDETQVGDRGMTLSGGQKARISLARACYHEKSFYLLDDPLSAVDAHVANHIFDRCIMGLLYNKTRILCTHQLKFLKHADWVVVMENGRIALQGPPANVLELLPPIKVIEKDPVGGAQMFAEADAEEFTELPLEIETVNSQSDAEDILVAEEERESGSVKFEVYSAYAGAVGIGLTLAVFISLIFMQGTRNSTDYWLAYWISHSNKTRQNETLTSPHYLLEIGYNFEKFVRSVTGVIDADTSFYLTVYGVLIAFNSIFTLLRAFLFAYGGVVAATNIHEKLIGGLFEASTSFFEKNPLGRILNRFSSDMYAVDDSLPFMLNILLAQTFGLLGTLIVTCLSLPWLLLLVIPLFAIYIKIQNYYRHTSRELKRLSAVTLSPIYSHFSETLQGLTSIRALRLCSKFRKENEVRLERSQRVMFANQAAGQWLNLCLQLIGVSLVTGVSLLVVVTPIPISLAGLTISYALTISSFLNGVVSAFTETEKEMVNAERALEYVNGMGTENWDGIIRPPSNWPSNGHLSFSHIHIRYREHLPYSLNDVSFVVPPGEKLGIVGRTGAGKSSLFNVLFRLVEMELGVVTIDDVNIRNIDLQVLRSSLAAIPQDPFLFSGTIRQNMDPDLKYDDFVLWEVLEQCHLSRVVRNMGGLEAELVDRGRDLSLGQKQLFCLARALLTKAKILCIDEATAAVDFETDRLIQQTIRHAFHNRTVLTIAHRIETVLHCDRVLVMSNGSVQELDAPTKLLLDRESLFYKLANKL